MMKLIQEKAIKRNISVDSMITLDAVWIINQLTTNYNGFQ